MRRLADRWLSRLPAVSVTYLAKLTVPPFGGVGLTIAVPLMFAAALTGLMTNRLLVDMRRFMFFVMMEGVLWGLQLFSDLPFSVPSLALLTTLHLPYVLYLRPNARRHQDTMAFFLNIAMVVGICGIAQYLLQYVIGPKLAFPIENYFPSQFVVSAFNQQGWLEYESEVYRANGVFMLEPSFFSQLMAIGILVELTSSQRWHRLLILATALIMSASGTGIIVLGVCLPVLAMIKRRWDWILLAIISIALVVAIGIATDSQLINVFFKRSTEFNATGSSAFQRYIAGFYMLDQFLWPDSFRTLVGFGAGQFQTYADRAIYPAAGTTFFKMIFEFGLVGATVYFLFLFYCVAGSSAPVVVRLALAVTLMLSGIHIPFAHGLVLSLLLWSFPPAKPRHAGHDPAVVA